MGVVVKKRKKAVSTLFFIAGLLEAAPGTKNG